MQITLNSYINNPTGGRARMVGERQAASATYSDKFEKLLLKSAGAIEYHIFKTAVDPNRVDDKKPNSNIDRYIIIIKIPFSAFFYCMKSIFYIGIDIKFFY